MRPGSALPDMSIVLEHTPHMHRLHPVVDVLCTCMHMYLASVHVHTQPWLVSCLSPTPERTRKSQWKQSLKYMWLHALVTLTPPLPMSAVSVHSPCYEPKGGVWWEGFL